VAEPEISVVIPTFHREVELLEAINSALGQPRVTVEVIVVDDSGDGSAEGPVASLGDERVRYVRRARPSRGVPALARNEGWAITRGRYVHFLDDDDRLAEGALHALMTALGAAPEAGVAIGTVRPFGRDPLVLRQQEAYFAAAAETLRHTRSRMALVATMLFQNTPLVNSACMIRRECVGHIGGYATNIARCEDVDFYLRAVRRYGFVFVDRPVVHYRTGAPSLMHSLRGNSLVLQSYRSIYRNYRREHGRAELLALQALARWRRASDRFRRRSVAPLVVPGEATATSS
jgi:glycosyltransferase involved in cell wall biosynthesis